MRSAGNSGRLKSRTDVLSAAGARPLSTVSALRRRLILRRHQHAQAPRVDAELERRVEPQGLAVDSSKGLAAARADLERLAGELVEVPIAALLSGHHPFDDLGRLTPVPGVHREDPSRPPSL